MRISVDGGGICADEDNRFGNYTFSNNLLQALNRYDKKNNYFIYTFCDLGRERFETVPYIGKNFKFQKLSPKKFWMKGRVTIEELIDRKDIFLALNQALPFYTPAKIISFSHGLSFYYHPEFYVGEGFKPSPTAHYLKNQLDLMIEKSKFIIVSSQRVRDEFINVGVHHDAPLPKIIVLPFGIPFDMQSPLIAKREKYFMFAGMNSPIKNIDFIIDCFNEFRTPLLPTRSGFAGQARQDEDFKLYLIGSKIDTKNIKNVINIPSISRGKLKEMYARATGYLTASHYESFNFPVLEALSQDCPVIGLESAIIPEMKKYVHYVGVGRDRHQIKNQFIEKMRSVAHGKFKKIDIIKLMQDFSWDSYVEKLVALYD